MPRYEVTGRVTLKDNYFKMTVEADSEAEAEEVLESRIKSGLYDLLNLGYEDVYVYEALEVS